MQTRSLRRLAAALLAAAASGASAAQAANPLDPVLEQAQVAGFNGVVLVGDGQRVLYERRVGARAPAADARWRWASVTKQLTAVLVMQAVEGGRLSLDDTVASRLPAFGAPNAARITVRQLLQHTSGLPNPSAAPVGPDGVPPYYRSGAPALGVPPAVCAEPPRAASGEGFDYNNCDYLVLGAMLERVEGRSFAELVRSRIAAPLGLSSLTLTPPAATPPGYTSDGAPEAKMSIASYGAAGAAFGTTRDLLSFDQALMADRLLKPATREVMWTGEPKLGYAALGAWAFPATLAGCAEPVTLIERRGQIGGVQVRNVIAPALNRVLVVFADSEAVDFGEVWQGRGLTYQLLSAAFCPSPTPGA